MIVASPLALTLLPSGAAADSFKGFAPATTFDVAPMPAFIATGDFNNNGVTDLAVTTGTNVQILLGNGDGSFSAPATFAAGPARTLAVGDLSANGIADLVVTNGLAGTVSILLGLGDGAFGSPQSIDVGGYASGVEIADLNNSGHVDLVVAAGGDVKVLTGQGDGTFAEPVTFAVTSAQEVAIADLNGNGQADIVAVGNGIMNVLIGKGDGTFAQGQTLTVAPVTRQFAIGDLNGNGVPDIAVVNPGVAFGPAPSIELLYGYGDGTFAQPQSYYAGGYPVTVAISDLNHDGVADLVVADHFGIGIVVLLGQDDGTFAAPQLFSSGGGLPKAAVVADFDDDGTPDVAVVNNAGTVGVLLGQTAATPGIPGDLNGDGSVGVADLLILLANWGPCADCDDCLADLTGSCIVGVSDLLILLENWG